MPGFGGFVSNLQAAKIHPVQHQFYPPSKSLGFNIHLKRNDGLLANNISQIEAVTYDKALKLITDFVNNCNEDLNIRRSCYIDKVGKVYYDVEKHLRFEADNSINYLLDSFGLTVIQSPPVKRDTLKDKVEKQVKYREAVKPVAVIQKKKFPWKTALILPVIGLFMWASVQTWNVYKKKADTGNLNPFENTEPKPKAETVVKPVPVIIPEISPEPDFNVDENLPSQPAESASEIVAPDEKPIEVKTEKVSESEISPVNEEGTKKYFIIAGAFAVAENAEKLIAQLKQKGFANAAIIDTTKHGLSVVAYNKGILDYSDALQQLKSLKADENPTAWLLKK